MLYDTQESVVDVTLCVVSPDAVWASEEVGGFEVYSELGHDGPQEVYGSEDSSLLTVPATSNALSVVVRDAHLARFVKYVSARAPSPRFDVAAVFQRA